MAKKLSIVENPEFMIHIDQVFLQCFNEVPTPNLPHWVNITLGKWCIEQTLKHAREFGYSAFKMGTKFFYQPIRGDENTIGLPMSSEDLMDLKVNLENVSSYELLGTFHVHANGTNVKYFFPSPSLGDIIAEYESGSGEFGVANETGTTFWKVEKNEKNTKIIELWKDLFEIEVQLLDEHKKADSVLARIRLFTAMVKDINKILKRLY